MLGETFNPKPKPTPGPKQAGQTVTSPRGLVAIALKNTAANSAVTSTPLGQALAARKKKKGQS